MKNLLSSIFCCAGALLVLALVSLLFVSLTSCGGGGGKLTVTPKVDVSVTPQPTMTMAERLTQLGLGGDFKFFEAYDDGNFLRAEVKPPARILSEGSKTDFGATRVWCKPWIVAESKFVETEITSFPQVEFVATLGQPSPGGDELLWVLFWHQVSGRADVSGTVEVLPDLFITGVWDGLNGGILSSVKQDYDATIKITDGEIKISNSNTEWLGWAAAAFIGFCPQVTFTWPVDKAKIADEPILTSVVVNPVIANLSLGQTQQFTAICYDQDQKQLYGATLQWSVVSGGGTISPSGLFTAGQIASTFDRTVQVHATYGNEVRSGYATVVVTNEEPPVITDVVLDPTGPYSPGQEITIYVYMSGGQGSFPPEIDLSGFTIVTYSWDSINSRWIILVRCPNIDGSYPIWRTVIVVVVTITDLPPVAVAKANPTSGTAPLTVNFDASDSSDSDGSIVEYAWDFESNQATDREGVIVQHIYTEAGTYTANLYVTDNDGVSRSDTITITVNPPTTNENFVLFVAGIDGQLTVGQTVHIQQGMGRAIANHFELRGDKGTTIPISLSEVQFIADDLPSWVWDETTGELMTVLWINPDNPDINDAGNVFITVTSDVNPPYPITFTVNYGGNYYSLGICLAVDANPAI